MTRIRFSQDQVATMESAGLLVGLRYELIAGNIIDKSGQSPAHAAAIRRLSRVLREHFPGFVQVQLPLEVGGADGQWSLPEPDLVVLAGAEETYELTHPTAADAQLVVEVADASLRHDTEIKRDLYARAGVREYWVLDIAGRRLVAHRTPMDGAYREVRIHGPGDEVAGIPFGELLPDR